MRSSIVVIGLLLTSIFCDKESPNEIPVEPTLLFKSGFESDVYIDDTAYPDNEDYRYIKGTDQETGFGWPVDVLGATESALHYIDDENHQAARAEIQTVIGHDGDSTRALYEHGVWQLWLIEF